MAKTKNTDTQKVKTEKVFKRDNGLCFTKVVIAKIVKNKAYNANFKFTYTKDSKDMKGMFMETSIGGTSEANCIEKTEKFLGTKLKKNEIQKL